MFPHSEVVIVESISKKTRAEDSAVVLVGERANYVPRRSQIPRVSALEPNYLIQRDAELRSVTHRAPENRQVLDADEAFARSLQEAEYHALQPAQLQLSQIDQLRRLIMDPYQLASLLGYFID